MWTNKEKKKPFFFFLIIIIYFTFKNRKNKIFKREKNK